MSSNRLLRALLGLSLMLSCGCAGQNGIDGNDGADGLDGLDGVDGVNGICAGRELLEITGVEGLPEMLYEYQ